MKKQQFDFILLISRNAVLRQFFSLDVLQFIGCQFALESSYGTSHLAKTQSNYCGMKVPFKRVFYGIKSSNDFAKYFDLQSCINDYIAWFFYSRPYSNVPMNLDSFIIHLRNSGYCPEKDYIDKIQSIYNQFKSYTNGN